MVEKLKYVGERLPRFDAIDIVTGQAKFLDDLSLPNLIYGAVLGSSCPHAFIKKVYKDEALKVKGVEAVLTHEDVRSEWKGGVPRITPILDKKVRFVGDAVALIAARTPEALEEALELIKVDYEPLPFSTKIEQALAPEAIPLYEELGSNVLPPGLPAFGPDCLTNLKIGNGNKGLAEADIIVEDIVEYTSIPNPLPHESPRAIALWEPPNRVIIWTSSQSPFREQEILTRVFNAEIEVRVIGCRCGGSFGSRALAWRWHCYAILLSMATCKPVKMVMSKEEQLGTSVVRLGCKLKARVGLKKDGTLTAICGQLDIDTGYYSRTTQAQVAVGLGELQLMFKCPNWDLETRIVCTNRMASGQVRGFGGQEFKCVLWPIVWKGLAQANVDPVEFIKKNCVKPGDSYYWRDGKRYVYRGIDFSKMIEEGAKAFGWHAKWKGWLCPTFVEGGKRRGIGVSIHSNADIGEDSSEVWVVLRPNGSASLVGCIAEFGTGQTSNYAKFVAEVLKLPVEKVRLAAPPDSEYTPYVGPAGGSRGTYAIGTAVITAAEDARKKLLTMFGYAFGIDPSKLDTENGEVYETKKPSRKWPWSILGNDWTIIGYGRFDPDYTLCNCMVSFVEVEVDTDTGLVKVLRIVNATDVGKVIDPAGLEGQMYGCLGAAGIDTAIFEETVLDHKLGIVLNPNLVEYKWRTFMDLPDIQNIVLETPFPSHRFCAVGMGEITTSPGPSAVLMAVCNALGRWVFKYPVTPEVIVSVLSE